MFTGFTFAHVGFNAENRDHAMETVETLCAIFGQTPRIQAKGSPYVGKNIEVVPGGKDGSCGHIAFYTQDLEAGIRELESRGVALDYDRVKRNPDGSPYLIYLKQEFCGFAVHLLGDKK